MFHFLFFFTKSTQTVLFQFDHRFFIYFLAHHIYLALKLYEVSASGSQFLGHAPEDVPGLDSCNYNQMQHETWVKHSRMSKTIHETVKRVFCCVFLSHGRVSSRIVTSAGRVGTLLSHSVFQELRFYLSDTLRQTYCGFSTKSANLQARLAFLL